LADHKRNSGIGQPRKLKNCGQLEPCSSCSQGEMDLTIRLNRQIVMWSWRLGNVDMAIRNLAIWSKLSWQRGKINLTK
jgi:hypothetical protein